MPINTNKLHILIGASGIFRMGGMQRATVDLANNLISRGHQVSLVGAQNTDENIYYPYSSKIELINIKPYYKQFKSNYKRMRSTYKNINSACEKLPFDLNKFNLYNRFKWHMMNRHRIDAWKHLCNEIRPDIAIGVLPDTFTILSIALQRTNIPLIINNHNNPWKDYSADRWDPNPIDLEYRMGAPHKAAANTVLLSEFKYFFSNHIQSKTYVIPNVVHQVSSDNYAMPEKEEGIKTIISTGRLVEVKDHKTLILAFKALTTEFPDWCLKIFGEGHLELYLKSLIETNNLQDNVFLCGHTDYLFDEYKKSQILVMPSLYEGWGLSITEAMSYGIPTIGFNDASGVNSLITHGVTGYLADGNDRVNSLTTYLRKLMSNSELRKSMGRSGIDFVRRYEPSKVYDLWEHMLAKVVAHSKL